VNDGRRDRDSQGRPKSARPRDQLGRPLPHGSAGTPGDPELLRLESADPVTLLAGAQRLLDDGRPFEAHEVLEAAWKRAPTPEKPLWRALAQLAVGLTHLARGNLRGGAALLRRSADELEHWPDAPYGIASRELTSTVRRLADGASAQSDGPPRVRLTR
jgi:hypothetical protein